MKKQPVISILGRPNVGKSTLFNRLTKTKKAIIDDTPGVTRDVLKQEFLLGENEIPVILQDTGGLTDEGDILNPLVQKKSVEALKTSDLILFMVEAKNVLPIEEEFINMIRKSGKPAIIIMNKSDSLDKDIYIHDFHQYGLGEPLPISAAHNRNIDELLEMIEAKLQLNIEEEDEDASNEETETSEAKEQDESLIKIAIVGKPNVGKSSLLNKITQKERSIVSNIPGTTRDIIDESITYKNHEFRFLDTAGIRKKIKSFGRY
ncbi:MAG: GTP-binding protein [Spirochaetales bacterium]|nr:GTP-binding protein [Spirochaetales bacterium]